MSVVLGQVHREGNNNVGNEKVVYIHGEYYITKRRRKMDDGELFAVYEDTGRVQDQKYSKMCSVCYQACVEYIMDRPSVRRAAGIMTP